MAPCPRQRTDDAVHDRGELGGTGGLVQPAGRDIGSASPPRGWWVLLASLVVVTTILAAACSGSDGVAVVVVTPSASPTGTGPDNAAFTQYRDCLTQHGVDVAQLRQFGDRGTATPSAGDGPSATPDSSVDQQKLQAAQQACGSLIQGLATQTPEQQAQRQQAVLAFAKCMRDQGIDFPDPQPQADGQSGSGVRGLLGNLDRNDPKIQAALAACPQDLGGFGNRGVFGTPPPGQ